MKKGNAIDNSPAIGLAEWFRPGEYERVEAVLADARALHVEHLRTGISWADWYTSEGDGWYAWLLPRLAQEVRVLPCVMHTPPSLGLVPKASSPPVSPKSYADFIDVLITRFDGMFDWIELWNQPTNLREWDSRLDPDWQIFSEMIGGAAYWIRARGKKTVLAGGWPTDLDWLALMRDRGVLSYVDAVGVQGFPGAAEFPWAGWNEEIENVRDRLRLLDVSAEIWITQTGFSTWRGDERAQIRAFAQASTAPVERVYWYSAHDRIALQDSFHSDQREYHCGLRRADGRSKALLDVWSSGGLRAVRNLQNTGQAQRSNGRKKHVMITGGAGFIGTNLAHRLLTSGRSVLIFDNLSRAGARANLEWLQQTHGTNLQVQIADVRDKLALRTAVRGVDEVYHFAAQVAVTSSLTDPQHDFEVNVGGTVNLLEALRSMEHPPPLLFTSTNKVYGGLEDIALKACGQRYQPKDSALRSGIDENRRLDFHSPYGCSKGAAEQYVLDYARSFDLPAIVFRMSCIYGVHQNGTEDQGWVAHFVRAALQEQALTLFGDGRQVRDLLYVDDLVDALLLALLNVQSLSGQAFNIGGGLGNIVSLLDLLDIIESANGAKPSVTFEHWRVGDQRYYVSDTKKFRSATGWAPTVSVHEGVKRLHSWLLQSSPKRIAMPQPRREPNIGAVNAVFTH